MPKIDYSMPKIDYSIDKMYFLLVVVIYICLQIFLFKGIVGADSYHYMSFIYDNEPGHIYLSRNLLPNIVHWIGFNAIYINLFLGVLAIIFSHMALSEYFNDTRKTCISLAFVALSPFFLLNTRLGMIDKNPYYMLIFMMTFYGLIAHKLWAYAPLVFLVFFWEGWFIVFAIIFYAFSIDYIGEAFKNNVGKYYVVISATIIFLILHIILKARNYLYVSEMLDISSYFFQPVNILLVASFLIMFFTVPITRKGLVYSPIITYFMVYRLHAFIIIPMAIIVTTIIFSFKTENQHFFVFMIASLFISTSFHLFIYEPIDTKIIGSRDFIYSRLDGKKCIFTDWQHGNMLQYYFPDINIINKGHPYNHDEIELFYKNQTMLRKECMYIYTKDDLKRHDSTLNSNICHDDYCIW